jgi:putative aldouronate transport system permease protein
MNLSSVLSVRPRPRVSSARTWEDRYNAPLYLMLLPALIGLLLFSYYPMYGIIIAFQRYDPLLGFVRSPWVGLENFQRMFANMDFWEILRNTLVISLGKIVAGQLTAITFALLLNELGLALFKRSIQTLTYLPYFFSWLVFASIMKDVLQMDGVINSAIKSVGLPPVYFLGNPALFPLTMILTDVWKSFGYGAIIFLAAITGIDPALQEAAAVDGANRFQRIWHVSLPAIAPIIVVTTTLALGYVLSAGFEQILILYNPAVYATGDIIDTWVYRVGLVDYHFSQGATVGLFKSLVGLVLVIVSFYVARKVGDYRVF